MKNINSIRKVLLLVILIIIVGYFILINLPLGVTKYKSDYSGKTLEIPYLSMVENECCMFGITFKNIRSVTFLENEINEILNQYEKISYNGKNCYYNKEEDLTITEYGVERGLIFNKIYFVYDTGRPVDSTTDDEDNNELFDLEQSVEIMNEYRDVLLNNRKFFYTDEGENIYLKDLSFDKEYIWNIEQFAIVDMNNDYVSEIVLESTNGSAAFIIVLHYENETVYGYSFVYRGLKRLKTDGTFETSSGASIVDYRKLNFDADKYNYTVLASMDNDIFYIDNKLVTEKEIFAFFEKQDKKENVKWFKYGDYIRNRKITSEQAVRLLREKIGEKDPTTDFQYSFIYEKIIIYDEKEYYSIRQSWLVENSHYSFIGQLFVSTDGEEIYAGSCEDRPEIKLDI